MRKVEDVLDHENFALGLLVDIDDDIDREIDSYQETSAVGHKVPLRIVSALNMDSVKRKTDGALDINTLCWHTAFFIFTQIEGKKVGLAVFV